MLGILKLVFTVILLCFFLPLSQCQFKNAAPIDVETDVPINPHEAVNDIFVVSEILVNSQTEFGAEHLIVILTFFMPFIFCFASRLRGVAGTIILVLQLCLSIWLVYFSREIVFFVSTPLLAGWVLIFSAFVYFAIIVAECTLIIKHKMFNNLQQ